MAHNTKILFFGYALMLTTCGVGQWSSFTTRVVFLGFACIWISVLTANLWYGVIKAGYPLLEEVRIGLIDVFAVSLPTAVTLWCMKRG